MPNKHCLLVDLSRFGQDNPNEIFVPTMSRMDISRRASCARPERCHLTTMTVTNTSRAEQVIARCREIAACTEVAGEITRTFLSPPMRDVHALLRGWMEAAGMTCAGGCRG